MTELSFPGGDKDQALITGRVAFGIANDGHAYPIKVDGTGAASWMFGQPTLFETGNGRATWAKSTTPAEYALGINQKGSTGWTAKLYGGVQSAWNDAASLYIPVNELPLTDLDSASWSYYMTNAELFGCQIQIFIHDPDEPENRADIIQSGSATLLAKAQGWNSHVLNEDTGVQFFWYGENVTGEGLTEGSSNLYSLAQFKTDALFSTWTIYRISLNNGFYSAGSFQDMYVADVKINGDIIPLKPTLEEQLDIVRDDTAKAQRVIPAWTFGAPTLLAGNNGKANWERGETSQATHQKGGTGWIANLYGGVQSGWDDFASLLIPVNELPIPDFNSAQWSYWLTNGESVGVNISIWVHDPTNTEKRADITQSNNIGGTNPIDKAQYWNTHVLSTDIAQFAFYGEGESGSGLSEATAYSWEQYQSDAMFSTWTIYRIQIDWGYFNSGTLEDAKVAEVILNGESIVLKPDSLKRKKTVKDTKALLATEKVAGDVFSNAVSANGTAWSWNFGGTGYITKAIITHDAAVTPRVRLHLWDFIITDSEAEMDDSDAFNGPVAAGLDYYIGYIDFPAMHYSGTGDAISLVTPSTVGNLPLEFNDHILYGVTEALDTFTPAATACNIYLTADMED